MRAKPGVFPPPGIELLGASSDHLIADLGSRRLPIGAEVRFQLNDSALLRAMTSPFVTKVVRHTSGHSPIVTASDQPAAGEPHVETPSVSGAGPHAA